MELADYIRIARNWFWLLLTFAFVGGGISFVLNSQQPARYTASSMISIGQYIDAPNANAGDINNGKALAPTYQQLLQTRDVLQGTIDVLNLNMSTQVLSGYFELEHYPQHLADDHCRHAYRSDFSSRHRKYARRATDSPKPDRISRRTCKPKSTSLRVKSRL